MIPTLINYAYAAPINLPLLDKIKEHILQPIINFLFVLAFFIFVWGIVEFIFKADDKEVRKRGRNHMLWGLIGLLIMVTVFGILNLICSFIGCA